LNNYEIMFLFDPTAGANWETVENEISRLMERADAEIIVTKRLEERRLAYEIKGRKRGLYVLTYFKAIGDRIGGIERDARLSEIILRVLILRAEGISEEKMRNATLGGIAQDHHSAKPDTPEEATDKTTDQPDTDKTIAKPSDKTEQPNPELIVSASEDAQPTEP